ncbi:MAG: DUF983 domain-containing protein [Microscillaceae bacterium]|nr:DUF983 domain-containing protein [Microscillaceae bacterium]MDW8460069.1 DUF983 domain-containing protein [Cytophagales bacterium]
MASRSLLEAMLQARCPQCRKGKMFKHNPYNIAYMAAMYENCSQCGLHYEREPGFFYGGMYISYAFSVAIFLTFGLGTYILLKDPPVWVYITIVMSASLLLFPLSFRYSRVLMLYLFGGVSYQGEPKEQEIAKK